MDRNLALEFVRVTEAAAIAASKWIGKGDKHGADGAAVKEMRARFNQIAFSGKVVIGEGEKDEAPMLYTGEKVGQGGPEFDLAIDPLECTDSVAYGRYNALAVIVSAKKGSLLNAPDTYMQKIAAGPRAAKVINLDAPVKVNITKVAKALGKKASDITVVLLDRDRHQDLIKEIRKAGARVRLITDGDVAGAIAPCIEDSGIDLLMGIGASTEAVLASAAVRIYGGELFARFNPRSAEDAANIKRHGIKDLKKIYSAKDLVKGDVFTFTATGVIDGPLLPGVQIKGNTVVTHSVVMRATSGTIRYISTHHSLK